MNEKIIAILLKEFTKVMPNVHFIRNYDNRVTYPYLTFTYTGEPLRENVRGFYIDVDVFDNKGGNDERIQTKSADVVEYFNSDLRIMTDDYLIRFETRNENPIPTGSDTLQRRYIQLYCKIDWRK